MPTLISPADAAGHVRVSLATKSATIVTASTTNIDPVYPATRLFDLSHPRRVCRSLSTATTRIVLDLAAATAIQAFSLERVNFGNLLIQGHASDSWASPSFSENFGTAGRDSDDGRRKRLCLPTASFLYRYVRLTPSIPDAGATVYEIGAFGIWPVLTTLSTNIAVPYEKTLEDVADTITLGGGGEEVGTASPLRVRLGLQANVRRDDALSMTQYRDLARAARNTVCLFYENMGDPTKMYHLRRTGAFTFSRSIGAVEQIRGAQFLEVA
jgi:hypothetical protein